MPNFCCSACFVAENEDEEYQEGIRRLKQLLEALKRTHLKDLISLVEDGFKDIYIAKSQKHISGVQVSDGFKDIYIAESQKQISAVRVSDRVVSFTEFGRYLLESVLMKRVNVHSCKECFLRKLNYETGKAVNDALKDAETFSFLAAGLSVVMYAVEKLKQVATNRSTYVQILLYMFGLLKYIKDIDDQHEKLNEMLNDVVKFIVKASLMCVLIMQSQDLRRFAGFPASMDAADIHNLEFQVGHTYPDLALGIILDKDATCATYSEEEENVNEYTVGIGQARDEVCKLLQRVDSSDGSTKVVVIYGPGGVGKTTLATAVYEHVDLKGYEVCRIDIDHNPSQDNFKLLQQQILSDLFSKKIKLSSCVEGQAEISNAFREEARAPAFIFIDNVQRESDLDKLVPLSSLPIQSRILITTTDLHEINIPANPHVERHDYCRKPLLQEEAMSLVCKKVLGSVDMSFGPGVELVRICGGNPLSLIMAASYLRLDGNHVSVCSDMLSFITSSSSTEDGDVINLIIDFIYKKLPESYKEAFLDIASFFNNWKRHIVAAIFADIKLDLLEEVGLIMVSQEGILNVHNIVREWARMLLKEHIVTDVEALEKAVNEKQEKLQKITGIWLTDNESQFELKGEHLELMNASLRVLYLGKSIKVAGECNRKFEKIRYFYIKSKHCLPMDLMKLNRVALFHGSIRNAIDFVEVLKSSEDASSANSGNSKISIPKRDDESSSRGDDTADDSGLENQTIIDARIIRRLVYRIDNFLDTARNQDTRAGYLEFTASAIDILISSMSHGFKSAYEKLKSIKFREVSETKDDIWAVMGTVDWHVSGLLVVAAGIQKLRHFDREYIGLLASVYTVARSLNRYGLSRQIPKEMGITLVESRSVIANGFACCLFIVHATQYSQFVSSSKNEEYMSSCKKQLERLQPLLRFLLVFGDYEDRTSLDEGLLQLSKSLHVLELCGSSDLIGLRGGFGFLYSLQKLDLSKCVNLTDLPDNFYQLKSLYHLNLTKCSELTTLPDRFGELPSLEELTLTDCVKLDSLPRSFGQLQSLCHLQLRGCSKLNSLPGNFGNLSSLEELNFTNCNKLATLSDNFGSLHSLSRLHLRGCSKITELPQSFGNLPSLKSLDFTDCNNLLSLPDGFGQLVSLSHLQLKGCSQLTTLPNSFSKLATLQELDLTACDKLTSIPDFLERLMKLRVLKFCCNKLVGLPPKFPQLIELQLQSCSKFTTWPVGFDNLSNLQELQLTDCGKLTMLPDDIEQLRCLRIVKLGDCSEFSQLPESIGKLSCLEELVLTGCRSLVSLPGSFSELKSLRHLGLRGASKITNYLNIFSSSLEILDLGDCSSLEILPQGFGQHSSLKFLFMDGCSKLSFLPSDFGGLNSLKYLTIAGCIKLHRLCDDFENLTSLEAMNASGCSTLQGVAMDSFVKMKSLVFVDIRGSTMLIERWKEGKELHDSIVARIENDQEAMYAETITSILSRHYTFCTGRLALFLTFSLNSRSLKVVEEKLNELRKEGFGIYYFEIGEALEQRMLQIFGYAMLAWLKSRNIRIFSTLEKLHTCIITVDAFVDKDGEQRLGNMKAMLPAVEDEDWNNVDLQELIDPLGGFRRLFSSFSIVFGNIEDSTGASH